MNSLDPHINVTPLIDVLLVLLIIFMIVSPLKPSRFEIRIPSETINKEIVPHPDTLIVKIKADSTLGLNTLKDMGTIENPSKLTKKLIEVFAERTKIQDFNENSVIDPNIILSEKIQKTVFVRAPKKIAYGKVIKIIDELNNIGAKPISLQIDYLE